MAFFFRNEKFFYMAVIWVAGRTRTPIIGSLQKYRGNLGHTPMGSDTLRGLVGRKGLEWYFPAVGQVRFLASQGVIGLSGRLSCK